MAYQTMHVMCVTFKQEVEIVILGITILTSHLFFPLFQIGKMRMTYPCRLVGTVTIPFWIHLLYLDLLLWEPLQPLGQKDVS